MENGPSSPMVTGSHHIRFYAGITLRDLDGFAMGALAVADTMPRGRLELEITESLLLEESSETLDILKSLKELGAVIALDDFGTGYSGLGYLNSFPIDKIKIDRSFTKDLRIKRRSRELVRAAINIGHSLGLMTLAEGIEHRNSLTSCALGCQQGQGFLFSRAIPATEISNNLKERDILISKGLVA